MLLSLNLVCECEENYERERDIAVVALMKIQANSCGGYNERICHDALRQIGGME